MTWPFTVAAAMLAAGGGGTSSLEGAGGVSGVAVWAGGVACPDAGGGGGVWAPARATRVPSTSVLANTHNLANMGRPPPTANLQSWTKGLAGTFDPGPRIVAKRGIRIQMG